MTRQGRRLGCFSLLVLVVALALTGVCRAQTGTAHTPTQDVHAKAQARLQTVVHIASGAATLQQVAQTLATQTGLPMQAETYLQPRKLLLHLNAMPAQDALDTLCELNDWRWYEKDGAVWITRHRVIVPQTTAELPRCLIAALPKDYRAFLGIGIPTRDLPILTRIDSQGVERHPVSRFAWMERAERITTRFANLAERKRQQADRSLRPLLVDGKTVAWTKLTLDQQALVTDSLLLTALERACDVSFINITNSGLYSYQLDINAAEVRLEGGNGLMIGSSTNGIYTSFGTSIPGLKSTYSPPVPKALQNP